MAHIKRGDQVIVIKGRERGKRGKVKRILGNRCEIEKVMMIKRHTKPTQKSPQGGIIDKEGTVPLSSVALLCEKCAKPRRTRAHVEGKVKQRACVKCDTLFPNPGM